MKIIRRDFPKFRGGTFGVLGLSANDQVRLKEVLAAPDGPPVTWLQASAGRGCSISFLNRITTTAPITASNAPANTINLIFRPTLIALAGDPDVAAIEKAPPGGGSAGTLYSAPVSNIKDRRLQTSLPELTLSAAIRFPSNGERPEIVILGVEPEFIDFGLALSPKVEAGLPLVIHSVKEMVSHWQGEPHNSNRATNSYFVKNIEKSSLVGGSAAYVGSSPAAPLRCQKPEARIREEVSLCSGKIATSQSFKNEKPKVRRKTNETKGSFRPVGNGFNIVHLRPRPPR